jgi:G3E family GTPase
LVLDIPEGAVNLDPARKPAHAHAAQREQFQALSFELSAPISAERFQTWLDSSLPVGLYRAKGLVRFDSSSDTYLFQLCGARVSFDVFDRSLDGSRLVFIGRDLDRETLAKDLDWCLAGTR